MEKHIPHKKQPPTMAWFAIADGCCTDFFYVSFYGMIYSTGAISE